MSFVPACACVAVLLIGAAAGAAEAYSFTLDGERIEPRIIGCGDGPHPGPGDLVEIGGWSLVLDGPGAYAWHQGAGRLTLEREEPEGRRALVAAELTSEAAGGVAAILAARPRADLRRLRGLRVVERPDPAGPPAWKEADLDPAALDWERLHLDLRLDDGGPATAALIPEAAARLVRSLGIARMSYAPCARRDLAALAAGDGLRTLIADGTWSQPIPGSWLARHRDLRHLDLRGGRLAGPAALAGHPGLRTLHLSWLEEPLDLGGLTDLPRLEEIRAWSLTIVSLPASGLPALRAVHAIGCGLDQTMVAAFRAANPQAGVAWRWRDPFDGLAARCDRLALRTGGTCHRTPAREQVLFSTADRGVIAQLLAGLELDERASGDRCMCCGSCTLEFSAGGRLLASLGIHHGTALRWEAADRPWPGDARLSPAGADHLCAWLAGHGAPEPARELADSRRADPPAEQPPAP